MISRSIVLLGFIFFLIADAFAQGKYELSYREIGLQEGLSQSTVTCFAQDAQGFIWVGTNDGLNRYDGISLKTFSFSREDSLSISSSWITDLVFDIEGNLWVATTRGINLFDYKTESFKRIKFEISGQEKSGYNQSPYVTELIMNDSGDILALSDVGVFVGNEQSEFKILPFSKKQLIANYELNSLTYSQNRSRLWFGLFSNGIAYSDAPYDTLMIINSENNRQFKEVSDVVSIREDPIDSSIWFGTVSSGLFRYKPQDESLKKYATINHEGVTQALNNQLIHFDNDTLLIGNSLGLFKFDRNTDSFSEILNMDKKTNYSVYDVFIDRSRNLFIGTGIHGFLISDLKKTKFSKFAVGDLPSSMIWSIHKANDGKYWFATDKGIAVYDSDLNLEKLLFSDANNPVSIVSDYFLSITGDENKIWAATSFSGIFEIDQKTYRYRKVPNNEISRYPFSQQVKYEPEVNKLINLTAFGLSVYDLRTKSMEWYDTTNSNFRSQYFWSSYLDSDTTLWLTHDLGLSTINLNSKQIKNYDLFVNDIDIFGYRTTNVVAKDLKNQVWVGTEDGLMLFDAERDSVINIYTEKDGLDNDYVYGILVDNNNSIWISTNAGLSQLINDNEAAKGKRIANYDINDGLQSNEFNINAYLKASEEEFLFGGIKGINRFNPTEIPINNVAPITTISNLKVISSDGVTDYLDVNNKSVSVEYGTNIYEFTIHALEYTNPSKNTISYRLLGFDDKWITIPNTNRITFTNLNPNTYEIQVRSSNNDQVLSDEVAKLTLIVLPPFYQTKLFIFSMIGLTMLIILVIIQYREKRLKLLNDRLEAEVFSRTREVQQNELIFRQISDSAQELIVLINSDGKLIYANPAHEQILGYSQKELETKDFSNFVHVEDLKQFQKELKLLEQDKALSVINDLRIRTNDGSFRIFEVSLSKVFDENDANVKFVAVAHDITRQKQIEQKLIETKNEALKMSQAKSAFLAGISHELRTPLNAILGFTQILSKQDNLSEKQMSYIKTMNNSGDHLLKMINEVLDISRIEANKMPLNFEQFSLHSLVKDISTMLGVKVNKDEVQFKIQIGEDTPDFIYSDPGKIRQILINILGNAIKFTKKGTVQLNVSLSEESISDDQYFKELIKSFNAKNTDPISKRTIRFDVIDTGEGIPKEKLSHIFEPFQQVETTETFTQGTGLGLAISKRLVDLIGGSVSVESELNSGSTFSFVVPALKIDKPLVSRITNHYQVTAIKNVISKKVLLVDDLEYNNILLHDILEPVGFICSKAYNGKEAIEFMESYQPDIILMDLKMPVMDGIEATRIIREQHGFDVKIIAVTASGFDGNRQECLNAGFDDFVIKPINENDLLHRIALHLNLEYSYQDANQKKKTKRVLVDDKSIENAKDLRNISSFIINLPNDSRKELKSAIQLQDFDLIRNWVNQHSDIAIPDVFITIIEENSLIDLIELSDQLE